MNAYSFDARTGYFSGVVNCQLDQIRSKAENAPVYLLPADATFLPPPVFDEHSQIAVWNNENWHLEELYSQSQQLEEKEEFEGIFNIVTNIINDV